MPAGATAKIACDALAVAGGWNPAVHLTCHLNGKPVWNEALAAFVPGAMPDGMRVAGAAGGSFKLADCLSEGVAAGTMTAIECGFRIASIALPNTEDEATAIAPLWHVKDSHAKAFVDFQNDVTTKDIALADREGFRSVEHLKRYTTLGMATDQGKVSNVSGLAILAEVSGRTIPQVGTTTYRPPYVPVSFGAMSGHHRGKDFRPTRLPPSHQWATEQGAVFVESGQWLRAQYYPRGAEKDWLETVNREVTATRGGVGVCDVSTLGKIEIEGADAAAFLDRVYCNTFSTLPVGKARYGLMLREDGFVLDDGTTSRLAMERFVMTTTTAQAGRVMQHLEFCHQVLWPALDVQMVSVSEQWAQFSVAGPRARDVLRRLVDEKFDLSDKAFPYLAAKEIAVGGVAARLFRLSFSGEMAYELAVPARYGDAAIRAIMAEGEEFGITPYGTEALA
jgi:sarcosine oxidase subunit alpha